MTVTRSDGEPAVVDAVDVVARFNIAFNAHDVDVIMSLMTEDCVFEGTTPPDGDRYTGQVEVRGAWEALFAAAPDATFVQEEAVAAGERVVTRWRYEWGGADGNARGHVRGVDLFRFRDGLISEKLSYVKG
jgi:ketosteroid isomerase-like protein